MCVDSVQYRDVVVEIERATARKPFLGGYRHRQTGAEYHHATAQTAPRPRAQSAVARFCRDTQTTEQRHARLQTACHTATQMTKIGAYVSVQQDRLLPPRPYTSADERQRTITNKALFSSVYIGLQQTTSVVLVEQLAGYVRLCSVFTVCADSILTWVWHTTGLP